MPFLGPTGVGKTETFILLTRHLFGSDDKLIRLDMCEHQEQRSIGILLGANLGERGLLGHYYTQAAGSGVLLLDGIEKVHPLILDLLHRNLVMLHARPYKGIGLVSSLGGWFASDGDNYHKMQMAAAQLGADAVIVQEPSTAISTGPLAVPENQWGCDQYTD
jgi:hypothetical protein